MTIHTNRISKRNTSALGEDCSCSQRILVEQYTAKQAIALSPQPKECDLYDMKALPEYMLSAIHESGLYDKYLTMPKMQFSLCCKGDKIEHLLNMIRRYDVLPGVQPMMKSIHVK
jgi:hypothetical protein